MCHAYLHTYDCQHTGAAITIAGCPKRKVDTPRTRDLPVAVGRDHRVMVLLPPPGTTSRDGKTRPCRARPAAGADQPNHTHTPAEYARRPYRAAFCRKAIFSVVPCVGDVCPACRAAQRAKWEHEYYVLQAMNKVAQHSRQWFCHKLLPIPEEEEEEVDKVDETVDEDETGDKVDEDEDDDDEAISSSSESTCHTAQETLVREGTVRWFVPEVHEVAVDAQPCWAQLVDSDDDPAGW